MKRTLMLVLFCAAAAAAAADDLVLLTDGSILRGTVLEANQNSLVLMDHGTRRDLSRDLVVRVDYNAPAASAEDAASAEGPGPSAVPAPRAVPAAVAPLSGAVLPVAGDDVDGMDGQDYYDGVAAGYGVPVNEVLRLRRRGIPLDELPVVFFLSARAHVLPGVVADMRLGGGSWASIGLRFNLGGDAFYWAGARGALAGPYVGIYDRYQRLPRRRWHSLALSDADIVNCVNLRFVSEHWHRPPVDVMRERERGDGFHTIWRGYAAPAGRHDRADGPDRRDRRDRRDDRDDRDDGGGRHRDR